MLAERQIVNAETLAAIQETRDIISGKKKSKGYATVAEMNATLDAETAADTFHPCQTSRFLLL
jgi:hypothetical protein